MTWFALLAQRLRKIISADYLMASIGSLKSAELIALLLFFSSMVVVSSGWCQSPPWQQYDKTISKKRDVVALSNDLFQENVDLYNGRISFKHVDIDLSGNNALPVSLGRSFAVADMFEYSSQNPFSDWELDTPRLSGVYASMYAAGGSQVAYSWSGQRCSSQLTPPRVGPFWAADYWYGLHASMPYGGELLAPNAATKKPEDGIDYRWVTAGFTWFSCLPSIKNSAGEGFLAISRDGTKYWFDWLAVYDVWPILESYELGYAENLYRKRNVLYATRVEDRFGNWVVYSYSNSSTASARLNRIESSDGRHIDLNYNSSGKVSSATDGARTWQYTYDSSGKKLKQVTLPDASQWKFDFEDAYNFYIGAGSNSSCDHPGWYTDSNTSPTRSLSLTHPSGAVGQFFIDAKLHGRSNVRRNCLGPYDASYSDFVRTYWTPSLIKKRITGPGLQTVEWQYSYVNSAEEGNFTAPNTGTPPGSWAATTNLPYGEPVCVSDSCAGTTVTEIVNNAGEWLRYTYGNSYRYNEHKLLKLEKGTGPNTIASVENYVYELALTGQPFPTPVGTSTQYKGDTYTEAYLRPMKSRTLVQDGITYRTTINSFDAFGRPLSVTKSSSP